jgi:hypothetical protein
MSGGKITRTDSIPSGSKGTPPRNQFRFQQTTGSRGHPLARIVSLSWATKLGQNAQQTDGRISPRLRKP